MPGISRRTILRIGGGLACLGPVVSFASQLEPQRRLRVGTAWPLHGNLLGLSSRRLAAKIRWRTGGALSVELTDTSAMALPSLDDIHTAPLDGMARFGPHVAGRAAGLVAVRHADVRHDGTRTAGMAQHVAGHEPARRVGPQGRVGVLVHRRHRSGRRAGMRRRLVLLGEDGLRSWIGADVGERRVRRCDDRTRPWIPCPDKRQSRRGGGAAAVGGAGAASGQRRVWSMRGSEASRQVWRPSC